MENDTLIQHYDNGKLTADGRHAFEARVKADSTFAQEVKEYRDVKAAIKSSERKNLKNLLQNIEDQEESSEESEIEEKTSLGRRYRHVYVAAAVIIFAVIAFQFFQKEPSMEDLYASYYQPYPNTLQPVVRGEENVNGLNLAFQAYEAQNYEDAAVLFESELDQEYDPDIDFYWAMSLLTTKQEVLGIERMEKLKKQNTTYTPQLYWYSALFALKNDQKEIAKEQLDSLSLLKSGYKDSAVLKLKKQLTD